VKQKKIEENNPNKSEGHNLVTLNLALSLDSLAVKCTTLWGSLSFSTAGVASAAVLCDSSAVRMDVRRM